MYKKWSEVSALYKERVYSILLYSIEDIQRSLQDSRRRGLIRVEKDLKMLFAALDLAHTTLKKAEFQAPKEEYFFIVEVEHGYQVFYREVDFNVVYLRPVNWTPNSPCSLSTARSRLSDFQRERAEGYAAIEDLRNRLGKKEENEDEDEENE
jgi:hypothetical protein